MTNAKRTHRPKQPENALPDPATKPRYCCAHSKGEDPTTPHRVIVVDEVRWDITRGAKGDHRIGYYNEATGRRGESWYASFRSGAEFWPAPSVEVAEKPTDPRNDAPPAPPPVAPAPTSQLPLTVAVHPMDLTRALALLERLTVAAETIAFHMSSPLRDAVPHGVDR